MSKQTKNNFRIFLGIILIFLGIVFIGRNLGFLDYDFSIHIFNWRTILIVIGAIIIFSSNNRVPGFVLIGIGTIGYFPEFWPLLLILFGAYIILKRNTHPQYSRKRDKSDDSIPTGTSQDFIDELAIFSGGDKTLSSDSFKGGKVTSIFGGIEIDLRGCKLAEGENVIDLIAIFGGTTITVPREWRVVSDVVPILGGFSDERRKDPDMVYDPSRSLVIKGVVIFGGAELKD